MTVPRLFPPTRAPHIHTYTHTHRETCARARLRFMYACTHRVFAKIPVQECAEKVRRALDNFVILVFRELFHHSVFLHSNLRHCMCVCARARTHTHTYTNRIQLVFSIQIHDNQSVSVIIHLPIHRREPFHRRFTLRHSILLLVIRSLSGS